MPGIGLVIGAMLFKQTYACRTGGGTLAGTDDRQGKRGVLLAITPLIAVIATTLAVEVPCTERLLLHVHRADDVRDQMERPRRSRSRA